MKKYEYKLLTINVVHLKKKKFQEELDNKLTVGSKTVGS